MRGVGLSGRSFIPLLSSLPAPCPASWPRAPSRIRERLIDHHDCAADDLLGAAAGVRS
jgi:hypothetical protein